MSRGKTLLAGIGNEWRSDDGIGPWIAGALRDADLPDVAVLVCAREVLELIEAWKGAETAFVFDALCGAGQPGEVLHIDALEHALPQQALCSSHSLNLADAVALGRSLDQLPERLTLIGVEGRTFDHGRGLSPEIEAAGRRVIKMLSAELKQEGTCEHA
ncbi:MAG: hydrogenase maturation protease [Nevskia sp.]|nr:hydrogenase maturation protease [Nevskia sp.]